MTRAPRKTAVERELEAQIEDVNRVHAGLLEQRTQLSYRIDDNRRFHDMLVRRIQAAHSAKAAK